jgi:hypothetical protein
MKPHGLSAELQWHDVSQRTGAETSGNSELEPPPHSALLPLALEVVERQFGKPFFGAAAAAAVANEEMAILNPDLLDDAVRAA